MRATKNTIGDAVFIDYKIFLFLTQPKLHLIQSVTRYCKWVMFFLQIKLIS